MQGRWVTLSLILLGLPPLVLTAPLVPAEQLDINGVKAQSEAILKRKKAIDLAAEQSDGDAERAIRDAKREEAAENQVERAPLWLKNAVESRFIGQDSRFKAAAMTKLKRAVEANREEMLRAEAAAYVPRRVKQTPLWLKRAVDTRYQDQDAYFKAAEMTKLKKAIEAKRKEKARAEAAAYGKTSKVSYAYTAAPANAPRTSTPQANTIGSEEFPADVTPTDALTATGGVTAHQVPPMPSYASPAATAGEHPWRSDNAKPASSDTDADVLIDKALRQKYPNETDPTFFRAAHMRIKMAMQAKLQAAAKKPQEEDVVRRAVEARLHAPGAPHLSAAATERLRKKFEDKLRERLKARQIAEVKSSEHAVHSDETAVESEDDEVQQREKHEEDEAQQVADNEHEEDKAQQAHETEDSSENEDTTDLQAMGATEDSSGSGDGGQNEDSDDSTEESGSEPSVSAQTPDGAAFLQKRIG